MHIHSIWRCSNTFYTSTMDVGSSQWRFSATTMSPCDHFIATITPWITRTITINWLQYTNCVRVHPHDYPQHIKVFKQFLYIKHGCGKQSAVVHRPNHVTMTSFHNHTVQKLPISGSTGQYNCAKVHPNAYPYPEHMKVLKLFLYIQHGCGKQSLVWSSAWTKSPCHHFIYSHAHVPKLGTVSIKI